MQVAVSISGYYLVGVLVEDVLGGTQDADVGLPGQGQVGGQAPLSLRQHMRTIFDKCPSYSNRTSGRAPPPSKPGLTCCNDVLSTPTWSCNAQCTY